MKKGYCALPWGMMTNYKVHLKGLAVLIALVLGLSCHNDKRPELFRLSYPPPPIEFDILPGLNTIDTHIYTISPLSSHYSTVLAASGHTADEISTIEARDAYISSRFGDVNLDFIRRISVYIYDPYNPADKIEFFYLDPVPFKDQTSIRLFPGITDVTEYIQRGIFGLEFRFDFRETTPTLAELKFEFELRALGK
jgi:hypothetical protein